MIALIDYGAGNVASVANALNELKEEYKITNSEQVICKADKVIFPGVGEASFAIKQLHLLNLYTLLRVVKKPFLGICLGMQLMAEGSDEGDVKGLGIFPGTSLKFDSAKTKVPHMGWNGIRYTKESSLFKDIKEGERFYFANSYYLPENTYTVTVTENNQVFSSSMEKGNFYGVQFHPEKSGDAGLQLLKNFIEI
ncbi:MAG: imidazole glycerol phosphate synthase subunit HisH [Ignavibacteriaceae bacterium]